MKEKPYANIITFRQKTNKKTNYFKYLPKKPAK